MTTEFWIQMIVYAVTFGVSAGIIKTKLKYIEEKLDKHNNLVERTYKIESDIAVLKSLDSKEK
ncbi:MAG: hypothetical protein RR540_06890 [Oscillospiraceae bacterium]